MARANLDCCPALQMPSAYFRVKEVKNRQRVPERVQGKTSVWGGGVTMSPSPEDAEQSPPSCCHSLLPGLTNLHLTP